MNIDLGCSHCLRRRKIKMSAH